MCVNMGDSPSCTPVWATGCSSPNLAFLRRFYKRSHERSRRVLCVQVWTTPYHKGPGSVAEYQVLHARKTYGG